jgi:Secretion system C-terminal sorting domain
MSQLVINWAVRRSEIPGKRYRFSIDLDLAQDLDGFDPEADVLALPNDFDLQQLRTAFRADVVVVLSDEAGYGTIAGIAIVGPSEPNAYAIADFDETFGPRWTLAHEIMHMFGARHNSELNGGNNTLQTCPRAWRFFDDLGQEQRTMLAFLPAEGVGILPRILNFSNPDVEFNGVATGTGNDDNARAISNTACEVADFEDSPIWQVSAYVPNNICVETNPSFIVSTINVPPAIGWPGIPPYSIEWRWNTTGVFPTPSSGTLIGSNANQTVTTPTFVDIMFIKLTVTASDFATQTFVMAVDLLEIGHPDCALSIPGFSNGPVQLPIELGYDLQIKVAPNPISENIELFVGYEFVDVSVLFVQIFDINGSTVASYNGVGTHHSIPFEQYPSGFYILHATDGTNRGTIKFVKP